MSLGPTHHGYFYQDLITAVALVDLLLGTAETITVDTKGFEADRFDDVNITYAGEVRLRLQIKHTTTDRKLSKETFSQDGRSLKLSKVFSSLLEDLAKFPETTYRIVVRDQEPDDSLAVVLKPVDPADRVADPLPGITTAKYRFDPSALRANKPWANLVKDLSDDDLRSACDSLIVDTGAPSSTISFVDPGSAERSLLRRVREDLGAGRIPNIDVTPEFAAYALVQAATSARVVETGVVRRDLIEPRLGLRVDFGAVTAGHPIETEVAVARVGAAAESSKHIDGTAPAGGRVVVVGEPGVGKSWLCEELTDRYRDKAWVVARHHCWLGSSDDHLAERVLTEVVIGSLLDQIGKAVPEATKDLRPKFATSREALESALQTCRETHPDKSVLLVVDGLDHVDRVVGRSTKQKKDPSRLLVEELAALTLPPGVCLLIASQPGAHLEPAASPSEPIQMPPMSQDEIKALTAKHGLLESPDGSGPVGSSDEATIVGLVHERSNGNALYATYLCRLAVGASPLDDNPAPLTVNELIHRLELVPDTATTVDEYYDYMREAMTADQRFATDTLALCDFSLTPNELAELLGSPIKSIVIPALRTLAPVLNTQRGLGGLRLHHESFSRYILRKIDPENATAIRRSIATWLEGRGFLADSRAFRHLPDLLANLNEYDQLTALVGPRFVADGIRQFHSPEALQQALCVVSREAEVRLDWPTLVRCIEVRKAIDTYENDALADTVTEYADVIVNILGAEVVAERLVYNGRPTFPPRWGLRISDAVDRAGAAAPWKAYIEGWQTHRKTERGGYSSDRDGTLQLAAQRGALRLRAQRQDIDPSLIPTIAKHLEGDLEASLTDLVETFTAGLPAEYMPQVAAAMTDPADAAVVYLTLADLAANGTIGLPDPRDLARQAWALDPKLDTIGYLFHGIAAPEVLAGLGITDLEAELNAATDIILKERTANELAVKNWHALLTLAKAIDPATVVKVGGKLSGVGFYRAWLRYTVATIGLADDVRAGTTSLEDASTAVVVALADLVAEAKPFTGKPRACDLYFLHPLIHQVIESSLTVVQPTDLDTVLDHLIAIGDGTTTTTNLGLGENGPLITNDLLAVLARASDHVGIDAIHALLAIVRERRNDDHSGYSQQAAFELETARICIAAGAIGEARECWNRAADLLASYGGHKDPTLSEIVESIEDIEDVSEARARLAKLVDLVYLVRQHTDGRDTSHYVIEWWEIAASVDPVAAARGAADLYLDTVGFEDARADAAQTHLLQKHCSRADPAVLAALRLTTGIAWRSPTVDLEVLTRLAAERGASQRVDAMLAVLANSIAASYDNQPMQHASDQSKAAVDQALVQAVLKLGGPEFDPRSALSETDRKSSFPQNEPKPAPNALLKSLVSAQRPEAPAGRAGAISIAHAIDSERYRDEPAVWDIDAATNSIGYRILEATLADGPDVGIALIDDVVREISIYARNDIFSDLGHGLAAYADGDPAVAKVASYCLATAYQRIRGGGGWRQFAGKERRGLWEQAHKLDPDIAERALAAAVTNRVAATSYGSYGSSQGLITAFAAQPTISAGGTPTACWDAAFDIISHRLPGTAATGTHVYHPTPVPDSADDLDVAIATLALATICQATREQMRLALLAAGFLLTVRPEATQSALAYILAKDLDAGRTTWLLEAVRVNLPAGILEDDLAAELTQLATSDRLSVRAFAGQLLSIHGRRIPEPPATTPAPSVSAAFHALVQAHEEEAE
ncbi:NACHT domain-containing protein [Nocardiopsis sp. Huas11]|uniref:NACHT domain-containing protein n=1 Tax=Nocardiopsis sp. Huas11 TaxID=2183912 RepID=UPI000EB25ECC|nr:NACHT domain-containing protein [Nocardiopsis sp. Huas11]RKS04930.1 NACHT domain-containing protein [Nocardiopsis sp. Huas11]